MLYRELYAGQRVCCTCARFQQHYYRGKKRYHEVHCGHCMLFRAKPRKPDQTCQRWKPLPSAEKASCDL